MKKLFEARAVVLECQAKQRLVEKEIELEHLQQKPKREWQGLTDEEIDALLLEHGVMNQWPTQKQVHAFARDIEAKLKEKNT